MERTISRSFDYYFKELVEYRRDSELAMKEEVLKLTESPIEAIVYMFLRVWRQPCTYDDHPKPTVTPQVSIGKYRVDFLVEYAEKRIVIECDGHEFHEKTKDQAARDKRKDRFLAKEGYIVLRYTGIEICRDPVQILHDINTIFIGRPLSYTKDTK